MPREVSRFLVCSPQLLTIAIAVPRERSSSRSQQQLQVGRHQLADKFLARLDPAGAQHELIQLGARYLAHSAGRLDPVIGVEPGSLFDPG
jgi:hypothetical protein